jgi:S1-C subfamily serine protease
VLNKLGEVVGIHYYATLTTSYELKVEYLNNVLAHILNRSRVQRGDIGITINLLVFGVAKINYKLNFNIADEIAKVLLTTGGPPEIMVVSSIYPGSSALGKLKGGDIIYKVNDKTIGNNFLLLDELLNEK